MRWFVNRDTFAAHRHKMICFKICTIESRNPVTRLIVRLISRDHSKVGWLNRCYLRVSILPQQNLITKWSVSDLLCYWIIILFNSTKPKINPGSVKSSCFEQSAWQYSKNLGTRNSELQIYYSMKEKNIGQHLLW